MRILKIDFDVARMLCRHGRWALVLLSAETIPGVRDYLKVILHNDDDLEPWDMTVLEQTPGDDAVDAEIRGAAENVVKRLLDVNAALYKAQEATRGLEYLLDAVDAETPANSPHRLCSDYKGDLPPICIFEEYNGDMFLCNCARCEMHFKTVRERMKAGHSEHE
jgi:hypothetical protein